MAPPAHPLRDEALRRVQGGESTTAVARAMGLPLGTVSTWATRWGLTSETTRKPGRLVNAERIAGWAGVAIEEVLARWDAGEHYSRVSGWYRY